MTDSLKSREDACHNEILYKCGCGSTYRYRSGLRRHKMDKNHWTLAHHLKNKHILTNLFESDNYVLQERTVQAIVIHLIMKRNLRRIILKYIKVDW